VIAALAQGLLFGSQVYILNVKPSLVFGLCVELPKFVLVVPVKLSVEQLDVERAYFFKSVLSVPPAPPAIVL
jgi:hypothetical protein